MFVCVCRCVCVCVCVRVGGRGVVCVKSNERQLNLSVTAVYAFGAHSHLSVVQWRCLCEVVTRPDAVTVACVLSA